MSHCCSDFKPGLVTFEARDAYYKQEVIPDSRLTKMFGINKFKNMNFNQWHMYDKSTLGDKFSNHLHIETSYVLDIVKHHLAYDNRYRKEITTVDKFGHSNKGTLVQITPQDAILYSRYENKKCTFILALKDTLFPDYIHETLPLS